MPTKAPLPPSHPVTEPGKDLGADLGTQRGPGTGLSVHGLSKRLGALQVLAGLDLTVAAGECVAILGESGAGKSTLLNLIAGLDDFEAGRICIGGHDLNQLDDDARTLLRRAAVGFVFQSFHILPQLNLQQNVELPLVLLGVGAGQRAERSRQMLAAVGLTGRAGSWPRELSGGELQRVAVARALVHQPSLVLADEPTGNLDPDTAGVLLELLLAQVRGRGAACLLVTHSRVAAQLADRVLVLDHGRLRPA